MRSSLRWLVMVAVTAVGAGWPVGLAAQNSPIHPPDSTPVTVHAATLVDGQGRTLHDVVVTVRSGRIERVDADVGTRGRGATYDLGNETLMPGIIDAHVHPGWYIDRAGALHNPRDGDTPAESALARAEIFMRRSWPASPRFRAWVARRISICATR